MRLVDVDGVLVALELGENAEVALMRGWKQDESVLSESRYSGMKRIES